MLPLVLYDIPSKLPGNTWSPNTAKTRFVLGYKNLSYEIVWVEGPEIALTLKKIGASTNIRPNGEIGYTVPVISDPNTGALVTDSWAIAEYLDKTYPEKPIFPKGSKGLTHIIESSAAPLMRPFYGICLLRTSQILNERSREYFIHTRAAPFGPQVDEWSPEGPKRDAEWETIEKKYFEVAKTWYEAEEGKWLMGDAFSYADILFATRPLWLRRVFRDDEWKRVASLHDGKWEKFLRDVEKECNLA